MFRNLEMDQENYSEQFLEPAPDCCIYRVPQYLRKINEEAYTPSLISIGPLHYGREELKAMEHQKRRYWSKVYQGETIEKLNELKIFIAEKEDDIRAHYSVTSTLGSLEYVRMILYDAVFVIELFLRSYHNTDDFLLKSPLDLSIKEDLLLLENQLPYSILNHIYIKAFPNNLENLLVLFLKYLFGNTDIRFLAEPYLQSKHFIDFYRHIFLRDRRPKVESNDYEIQDIPPTVESNDYEIYDLPCATKLNISGLKFKGNKFWVDCGISLESTKSWFSWVNELQIPTIQLNDSTERLFRNLMAFEMFHYSTETHICHYTALMNQLIDTEKDVDLLVEKGIIVNSAGSKYKYLQNHAKAMMFNRLVSGIVLSKHSCFNDIAKMMKAHYEHPWNRAKATLRIYFCNHWACTATVSAIVLLILTVIQTICSVMQVV